jgi:hypothetical protein
MKSMPDANQPRMERPPSIRWVRGYTGTKKQRRELVISGRGRRAFRR